VFNTVAVGTATRLKQRLLIRSLADYLLSLWLTFGPGLSVTNAAAKSSSVNISGPNADIPFAVIPQVLAGVAELKKYWFLVPEDKSLLLSQALIQLLQPVLD
jgi:hypothetical protein